MLDLAAYGERLWDDPYAVFDDLRRSGDVHPVQFPDGSQAWLILGHAEVRRALTDPTLSKNWQRATGRTGPEILGRNMLTCDPPDHTRLRRLISRTFSARRIATMAASVQATVDTVLGGVEARGTIELVTGLAVPVALGTVVDLLGVPFLERGRFRRWTNEIMTSTDPAVEERLTYELVGYLDALVEHKRTEPGDDLLSEMIRAVDEDGGRLSHDELRGTAFLLLLAGHETTVNLIANGVHALLTHRAQLAALRADWTLVDAVIDEVLRWEGPLTYTTTRFTTDPYRVGAVTIPGDGSRVLLAIGSASRDAALFPEPHRFDIHRPPSAHFAFGYGIHHCLGAPLARLEGRIVLRALFTRFSDLALVSPTGSWRRSLTSRAMTELTVRWTPPATAGAR